MLACPKRPMPCLCILAVATCAASAMTVAEEVKPTDQELEFFEKNVRPLLAGKCWSCHGPKKQESGLRIDRIEYLYEGGDRGPAVVPGRPEESWLYKAVAHVDAELRMPPKGEKLQASVALNIRRWIEQGAPWPEPRQRGCDWKVVRPPRCPSGIDDCGRGPCDGQLFG